MKTREFIRIQLDATPDAIHTWLESAALLAERISVRTHCVASLEIEPNTPNLAVPARSPDLAQRRFGIFNGDGVLVLNADLCCTHAGTTVLELRRDEAFPLVARELLSQLDERFPGASSDVLAERQDRRSGAPPLACNVWLEEQLRRLPNPAQCHHLYATWLAHYITLRGYEPLDPRRSFRAAVRGCLRRMRSGSQA